MKYFKLFFISLILSSITRAQITVNTTSSTPNWRWEQDYQAFEIGSFNNFVSFSLKCPCSTHRSPTNYLIDSGKVDIIGDTLTVIKILTHKVNLLNDKADSLQRLLNIKTQRKIRKISKIDDDKLKKVNELVKNINLGGCGWFAYRLWERLDTSKYIFIQVKFLTYIEHIMIKSKSKDLYIDSDGMHSKSYVQEKWGSNIESLYPSTLRMMVYEGDWNTTFNKADTTKILNYFDKLSHGK